MTVIYNDTCPICSREVNGYKAIAARHALDMTFAGWSESDLAQFGLTKRDAARRFHVLKDGELISGIPAFAVLWADMPGLRWLSRVVRLWGVRQVAALAYDYVLAPALFAMHRRRQARDRVANG